LAANITLEPRMQHFDAQKGVYLQTLINPMLDVIRFDSVAQVAQVLPQLSKEARLLRAMSF
jgi:hypothetical protein